MLKFASLQHKCLKPIQEEEEKRRIRKPKQPRLQLTTPNPPPSPLKKEKEKEELDKTRGRNHKCGPRYWNRRHGHWLLSDPQSVVTHSQTALWSLTNLHTWRWRNCIHGCRICNEHPFMTAWLISHLCSWLSMSCRSKIFREWPIPSTNTKTTSQAVCARQNRLNASTLLFLSEIVTAYLIRAVC